MKQVIYLFFTLLLLGCSIEQGDLPKDGEDGSDGRPSLIRLEPTEEGVVLHTGIDLNSNGVLDDNEIIDSYLLQDGQDGSDGEDGTDGEDGFTTLIKYQTNENGYTLFWGLDLNRNGELDEDEVTSQITLNNGEDGLDGKNGENGYNTLISIVEITEEMESVCEAGIRTYYGLDTDRDGSLSESEITGFYDVCKCECDCPGVPYYEIEYICCDDYESKGSTVSTITQVCEVTGLKITKGIVGKPELETVEIICFN